jgi:hypothetical protein
MVPRGLEAPSSTAPLSVPIWKELMLLVGKPD